MSDPIESNKGVTPDDNSTAKTYELPSNETKISDKTSTVDTALSFDKLCVHSDSESSGDEITAFDRIRASSDSDEGEATKTIKAISVSKELPPVPVTLSTPVTETEEVKVEETLPEDMLEETVKNSEVTKEIIEAKSHNNTDVSSIQEPNNTPDKKVVVEDEQKSKEESDKIQPGVSKDKPKSPEEKSSIQSTGDWNESEKGNKYSQNKDFSREKGKPRKSYPEDSFRDGNKRERGKGRSNRDDRGVRRENYGHDDRFYVSPDTRTNEPEFDSNVIQGRSPPTRSWKGTRGRGGEGKWKHDKFYEDEQGPIAVESTNNSYPSYSSPQSVSQSQYPYKKGRGRGKKQYSDQSPIPGFQRNSPRQERRGRGNPYKEESDVYSSSTRPNRGRGINRYSNYKEDNSGVYHSKPIVFVSQNKKIEPPTDRHKDQDNTR
ncbi:hypothetical protein LOD99_4100 [Oopsacas minuta]|uniref:Btz domain-containing protein n=1 Tax=Oopsacas minuta TaxID=111878 RepID=A0AAV7JVR1_9METZ|nr:hypothetical protein LOD99_4100 [Oopsacas minuta]